MLSELCALCRRDAPLVSNATFAARVDLDCEAELRDGSLLLHSTSMATMPRDGLLKHLNTADPGNQNRVLKQVRAFREPNA